MKSPIVILILLLVITLVSSSAQISQEAQAKLFNETLQQQVSTKILAEQLGGKNNEFPYTTLIISLMVICALVYGIRRKMNGSNK